jgi:flavin reductase (DIM6/NTAB) family NADH-FMN oxidoreductase RutF
MQRISFFRSRCLKIIERGVDMPKKSFPLSKVYGLLEPGPVVMVTTAGKMKDNIMTMSWCTMMEFQPPIVGCVISNRNYTFNILKATKECVINIPTLELAGKVVACGNSSGRRIDKFKVFGLTQVTASCVKPPLIGECYANLECKVVDEKMVDPIALAVYASLKVYMQSNVNSKNG